MQLPYNIYLSILNFLPKQKFVLDNFPEEIVNLFTLERMANFPILEYKEEFLGLTDYIDGILPQDMTHPIMMGVDKYKRAFIAIRTYQPQEKKTMVDTIFQRYTKDKLIWSNSSCGFISISYVTDMDEHFVSNINKLLNNESDIIYPYATGYITRETILC
jgi:hypothetical protein